MKFITTVAKITLQSDINYTNQYHKAEYCIHLSTVYTFKHIFTTIKTKKHPMYRHLHGCSIRSTRCPVNITTPWFNRGRHHTLTATYLYQYWPILKLLLPPWWQKIWISKIGQYFLKICIAVSRISRLTRDINKYDIGRHCSFHFRRNTSRWNVVFHFNRSLLASRQTRPVIGRRTDKNT